MSISFHTAEEDECQICAVRLAMIRAIVESIDETTGEPQVVEAAEPKRVVHDSRPPEITFECANCKLEHLFPHPDKHPREDWPSQSKEYEFQPRGWIQENKKCGRGGRLKIVN